MKGMTWGEFKRIVEDHEVTDDMLIHTVSVGPQMLNDEEHQWFKENSRLIVARPSAGYHGLLIMQIVSAGHD